MEQSSTSSSPQDWWTGPYSPGDFVVVRLERGRYCPGFVPTSEDQDVTQYAEKLPARRMLVRFYLNEPAVVVAVRHVHDDGHRGVTAGNFRRAPRMEAPPVRIPRMQVPRMQAPSVAPLLYARSLRRRTAEDTRERAGQARAAALGLAPVGGSQAGSASERSSSARSLRAAARQAAREELYRVSRACTSVGAADVAQEAPASGSAVAGVAGVPGVGHDDAIVEAGEAGKAHGILAGGARVMAPEDTSVPDAPADVRTVSECPGQEVVRHPRV